MYDISAIFANGYVKGVGISAYCEAEAEEEGWRRFPSALALIARRRQEVWK